MSILLKILTVSGIQLTLIAISWFSFQGLFAVMDGGNMTSFGVFGIDIIKSIVATILGSVGLTAGLAALWSFSLYGQ